MARVQKRLNDVWADAPQEIKFGTEPGTGKLEAEEEEVASRGEEARERRKSEKKMYPTIEASAGKQKAEQEASRYRDYWRAQAMKTTRSEQRNMDDEFENLLSQVQLHVEQGASDVEQMKSLFMQYTRESDKTAKDEIAQQLRELIKSAHKKRAIKQRLVDPDSDDSDSDSDYGFPNPPVNEFPSQIVNVIMGQNEDELEVHIHNPNNADEPLKFYRHISLRAGRKLNDKYFSHQEVLDVLTHLGMRLRENLPQATSEYFDALLWQCLEKNQTIPDAIHSVYALRGLVKAWRLRLTQTLDKEDRASHKHQVAMNVVQHKKLFKNLNLKANREQGKPIYGVRLGTRIEIPQSRRRRRRY
jgi:sugar-specific transcriptional regulator TrmB